MVVAAGRELPESNNFEKSHAVFLFRRCIIYIGIVNALRRSAIKKKKKTSLTLFNWPFLNLLDDRIFFWPRKPIHTFWEELF